VTYGHLNGGEGDVRDIWTFEWELCQIKPENDTSDAPGDHSGRKTTFRAERKDSGVVFEGEIGDPFSWFEFSGVW